jgi:alpha-tubulin suppressor-like RCC1 family protein
MRRQLRTLLTHAGVALALITAFANVASGQQVIAWGNNSHGQTNVPPQATNIMAVAGGARHSVALREDGSVLCWGSTTNVDAAATNVIAISAGALHTLALRADGAVVAWGDNAFGQADIPEAATNVLMISAGHYHNLALRADGSVVAWGDNSSGQANIDLGGGKAIAIAAGAKQSLVMKADGVILGFGEGRPISPLYPNTFTALACSPTNNLFLSANGSVWAYGANYLTPASATNVVSIAVGTNYNLALKADGRVVAWGAGAVTNVHPSVTNVFAVGAGFGHGLAIKGNGLPKLLGRTAYHTVALMGEPLPLVAQAVGINPKIFQWSTNGLEAADATNAIFSGYASFDTPAIDFAVSVSNAQGAVTSSVAQIEVRPFAVWDKNQLDPYGVKKIPTALTDPVALSIGANFGVGLNADGALFAWGNNSDGQTDVPVTATNVGTVVAGSDHALALRRDGTVIAWGRNWDGQCDVPAAATNVVAIAAGWAHSLALRGDGTVIAWGSNEHGQSSVSYLAMQATAISAGYYHSLALRSDGKVISWGALEEVPEAATNIIAISAGWRHNLALREDGTVLAWGTNDFGQCNVPASATNVIRVVAGWFSSFALRADGMVIGWGGNQFSLTNLPPTLSHVSHLTVGEDFAMALASQAPPSLDNPVNSVAAQAGGQAVLVVNATSSEPTTFQWYRDDVLQSGATNQNLTLKPVGGADAGAYTVVACNGFGCVTNPTLALTVSDTPLTLAAVGCWGDDLLGQRQVPTSIVNPQAISAGAFHNLLVNGDGTVLAWGKDIDGQATVSPTLTNAVAVAAGGDHSLALLGDGTVVAWGRNWDGQTNVPAQATNVISIAAGWAHSLALRADGTLIPWGNNAYGQTNLPMWMPRVTRIASGYFHNLAICEDGSVVAWGSEYLVPGSVSNAVAVAAGFDHSLALRADGTVVAWGGNAYGQTNVPLDATNLVAIAAGWGFSVGVRADGVVKVWGKTVHDLTEVPLGLENIAAIAGGEDHILALAALGPPRLAPGPTSFVVHTGGNAVLSTEWQGTQPLSVHWSHNGSGIAGGSSWFLSLTNLQPADAGAYTIMATNAVGQVTSNAVQLVVLETPHIESRTTYQRQIVGSSFCVPVSATGGSPLSYQWLKGAVPLVDGANVSGATTDTLCINNASGADGGDYHVVVNNPHGSVTGMVSRVAVTPVIVWGDGSLGQQIVPVEATNVLTVAAGNNHNVALTAQGRVLAWGDNSFGQAIVPDSATNVVGVAAGDNHSLALRRDGSVVAWGDNGYGQTNIPPTATDVLAVAAGGNNSVALRADGKVIVWGLNLWGLTNPPASATNVVTVAVGKSHAQALRLNGSLVSWGSAGLWLTLVPASVKTVAIAAGGDNSVALFSDGSVVVWGDNSAGQTNVPVAATNVAAVDVDGGLCLALRTDGTLVAWGAGPFGQTNVPAAATNVVAIAAGEQHAVALVRDGQFPTPLAGGHTDLAASIGDLTSLHGSAIAGGRTWYQWSFNGLVLAGETNAILGLTTMGWTNVGTYTLVASNAFGLISTSGTTLSATRSPLMFDTNSLVYNAETNQFSGWVLGAAAAGDLVVFASSDLQTWTPVFTNPPVIGPVSFSHEAPAESGALFYRAAEMVGADGIRVFLDRPNDPFAVLGSQLRIEGLSASGLVIINASSDLVNWTPVHTNPPTIGPLYFFEAEPAGSSPQRFFRAFEQKPGDPVSE